MVIDLLINAVFGVLGFAVDILPDVSLPSWAQPDGPVRALYQSLLDGLSHFGNWIPFEVVGVVSTALLTTFLATTGYRVIIFVRSSIKSLPFL